MALICETGGIYPTLMNEQPQSSPTPRETWVIRLALAVFVVFAAFGVYVLFYPTDQLTDIFGVLLLVTLVLGVIVGLVTAFTER